VRLGLIGCGGAGSLRAEAMAGAPGLHLVAVADLDSGRAAALARRTGAAIESGAGLLRRPDIEAVIVATPPDSHASVAMAALAAGKHVLCEKPLARSPAECRLILEAAERAGRFLATGFNYRFYPAVAKSRTILASGVIGALDHIRSYAGHPGGREFTRPWVHDVEVMGGGALLDNGIHLIDLTRHFLGEVSEVKAYTTSNVWAFPGCEDNGFALLKSPVGRVATLHASWSEWRGYRFRIEIYGTRGSVRASYPPMLADTVWLDAGGRRRRRVHLFPALQVFERLRSHRWTGRRSLRAETLAFARAAAGEKTDLALGLDGLRAVEIAHAAYRASREGAAIRLDGQGPTGE